MVDTWRARLTQQGHDVFSLFLNSDQKNLSETQWQTLQDCPAKTIILDGEEQLSWRARCRFYQTTRNCTALIVLRHHPGKLPTLIHLDPDIKLLHRCVRVLSPQFYPQLRPLLPIMWKNHHGNLRNTLLNCFDAVSKFHQSSSI
ncbi:MAG: hypothetical protein HKP20_02745 [Akkermansiaceae bacterium]|nr:hypothetical protein [Akkermansiaceae bacterium]